MMTTSVVSAGAASAGYYKAEGYYKEGTPEAEAATQWIGRAAEKFGLVGEIDDEKFAAVLGSVDNHLDAMSAATRFQQAA